MNTVMSIVKLLKHIFEKNNKILQYIAVTNIVNNISLSVFNFLFYIEI